MSLAQSIVEALGEEPLRLSEIAALVGRQPRDGSVRRALSRLVEDGELVRDGALYERVPPESVEPAPGGTSAPSAVRVPPARLGDAGREAWELAWSVPWAKPSDAAQIAHLARLEDEAAGLVRTIEEQGVVAKRPIVTPKGEVVGEEWSMHPAIAELRKLDSQLVTLRASLGLDPTSRARVAVENYDRRPDCIDELQEQRRRRLAAVRLGNQD